ncbi:MAG: DUF1232 domain-containing protein [bacterium]|nr:DUF1232 domain-containing protein [bacterium]
MKTELGLLYCLSMLALIPEWLPVLGVMDNLGLAALLIIWVNHFTLPEDAPQTDNGNKGMSAPR